MAAAVTASVVGRRTNEQAHEDPDDEEEEKAGGQGAAVASRVGVTWLSSSILLHLHGGFTAPTSVLTFSGNQCHYGR